MPRPTFPERVQLSECWARDGIQPESPVSTRHKLTMLEAVAAAGFRRAELTSFAHPKAFPQFADASEVVRRYVRHEGVEYAVLIPNLRGYELMVAAQGEQRRVDSVTLILAASEAYNRLNTGRAIAESLDDFRQITRRAHDDGILVTGCIGTAWGCPIEGSIDQEHVLRVAGKMRALGVDRIMLGDTTGEATPARAHDLVAAVRASVGVPVIAHFHDQRGSGVANAIMATVAGAEWIDVALGGTGGHRPEKNIQNADAGNVCTEDLAATLAGMGIDLGLDFDRLLTAGRLAEQVLGRTLQSKVQRAGLPATFAATAAPQTPPPQGTHSSSTRGPGQTLGFKTPPQALDGMS